MSEVYSFLPWVRQGLNGAGLPAETLATNQPASAHVPVELMLNQNEPIRKQVRLAGPADVVGIDPRQVVRCDPAPHTRNFEPNFLAAVEFDQPDFPWMFTPASANAQSRLRPWLCLVVVKRGEGVRLRDVPGRRLRALEVNSPADELPDLKDSWAWAHAQVSGSLEGPDALDRVLTDSPQRTVSRLICPRRLQPGVSYIACVVPAFEAGRKAGLGIPLGESDQVLEPAWHVDAPTLTKVTLPVYYSWEFSTGPSGDFQALVEQLTPRAAPSGLGGCDMVVGNEVLTFEGALRAVGTVSRGLSAAAAEAYRGTLRLLVNGIPGDVTSDPVVAPPIYAGRYFDIARMPGDLEDTPPAWLRELNLDPRYRAAAALGTGVIQVQQEALMASAWEQAGEIGLANAILRNAQLVRAASSSIHRNHLSHMPESTLLEVSRPVHGRVMVEAATTIEQKIAKSSTPVTVTTSAFRRIARPRGPIMRRVLPQAQRTVRPFVADLTNGKMTMKFLLALPSKIVTAEAVEALFKAGGGKRQQDALPVTFANIASRPIPMAPKLPNFPLAVAMLPAPGVPVSNFSFVLNAGEDRTSLSNFRAAVAAHQPLIAPPTIVLTDLRPLLPVAELGKTVLAQLDPAATMPKLVRPLIRVAGETTDAPAGHDELEPLRAGPRFPQPMYEGVRDLSQDLLLPGLEAVGEDSVMLLESNPRFVEAYMAGLNHEMGREFLWRGYPADPRATPFRHFWDTRGRAEGPADDIPPIERWSTETPLGANAAGRGEPSLVLLIRGELLRRYPTAIVYAASAVLPAGQARPKLGEQEVHPIFHGSLKPDVVYFGFPMTAKTARGNRTPASPGFFIVIQEHPTEPRFGLEANDTGTGDLKPQGNAAETARKLLQRPVRIAIHAQDLLPAG